MRNVTENQPGQIGPIELVAPRRAEASLASVAADGGPLAVTVQNLSKVFMPSPAWMKLLLKSAINQPVTALENVSFELDKGETCVVVGPNGAGKSTLFRILIGLTTPTSGQAHILGHDIAAGRRVRSLIGYMPAEDRNLMLRHTCAQNLEFRGRLQGMNRKTMPGRIDEVLEQVGIGHARDQAATSLSTGMKARLQLAAALLHQPRVLIRDEPTSAVDPVGAHELLTLIEDLTTNHGLSVVISSHRLEEIDALENKVVFLDHGRVIHYGNLRELRRIWEQPRYRLEFSNEADPMAIARRLEGEPDFEVDVIGSVIEVTTKRPVGDILAVLGPSVDAITSIERAMMPLRVLFHKLISGEIRGEV
jgi:ABC-2 type transport system ATP-binding protein